MRDRTNARVLILVLMEDALALVLLFQAVELWSVLILVLMEDALARIPTKKEQEKEMES